MSQTKIMDFCGSGELMRAILTDHHTHDALVKGNANKKFYVLIFAEDDKPECPPIMPGDQMAYNNGNGWDYVTFGCIERGPINKVPAESVCPDLKTTLQGNDLSVQVEDDLRFGESMEALDGRHEPEKDEDGFTFWHSDRMPPWVDLNDWVEVKGSTQGINHPALLLAAKYVNWADVTAFKKQEYQPKFGPDKDGWIEWRGGECPVPLDTRVFVKFRVGISASPAGACRADEWRWDHRDWPSDIVAYKLADQFSAERGDDEESQV